MFKSLSLSCAWNAGRHTNGREMVEEILNLGFKRIELNFSLSKDIVKGAQALQKEGRVAVTSVHNYCPIPDDLAVEEAMPDAYSLASVNDEERRLAVKFTKGTIDTASAVEAECVILHAGRVEIQDRTKILASLYRDGRQQTPEYKRQKEEMLRDREAKKGPHLERAMESLKELCRYASDKGVKLAIENRYYFGEIPSQDEVGLFLNANPELFYWHDVGHAQFLENLGFLKHLDYLRLYSERMVGIHLHNIIKTRDHQPPLVGEFDFSVLKPYVKDNILLVIESHPPATGAELREGAEYLEKLFRIRKEKTA